MTVAAGDYRDRVVWITGASSGIGEGMETHALWFKRFFPDLVLRLASRLGGIEK